MPGIEFLWQDPNGKLRAEHFDISPIFLYMAENLPNYCDRKGPESRLLRFQPYYRTIETEPSDVLSNGFPWPRYKTKFVRQNMPAVDVADAMAPDPKERCTPEGRAQLMAFSRWIASFTSMSSSR
jgi:hypothetical protein